MNPEPATGIQGSALLRSVVTNIERRAKLTVLTQRQKSQVTEQAGLRHRHISGEEMFRLAH
jgi:hypothetical protein